MTYEEIKRIRQNPTLEDVDNQELAELIDAAIEKQIPQKPEYEADGYDENGELVYDTAYCPICRQRERLIELLKNQNCPSTYMCDDNCKYAKLKSCYEERTADYLLENGVIVPPVKVGDTVYQIANGWRVCESKITWFYWDKDYKRVVYDCNTDLAFSEEAIGKSVFLSKEDAKKALEEMKNV